MTNGRYDMMDVMAMMTGEDLTAEPESCGRIVTGFNGLILGLETQNQLLDNNSVYEIESKCGVLTLKKKGKSHIDFNSSNKDISTLLLTESTKLILTTTEKHGLELENEIELNGFITTRDKYLVLSDKGMSGAEEKIKVLTSMYPPSKNPEKWV